MNENAVFSAMSDWMFSQALPFWAEYGPDRQFGGYIEELDFSGKDLARPFKRTRVTCRQVYVFSHAKKLGWSDGDPLIHHGLEYLAERAWRRDGGFARRLDRNGEENDPTPDLYDHAFALFAFAWAFRATGDSACRDWANRTMDYIDGHFTHPSGAGYWHALPAEGPRLQNPHMHLLEASLEAFDAIGDERYRETALHIVGLFKKHFFERRSASLIEYFKDDWSPAPGAKGEIAEPGHQLEWAWILENCQRKLGVACGDEIRALVDFSERLGINAKTGAVMNSVTIGGRPIDAGSRTWPNTERIKSVVALRRLDENASLAPLTQAARILLERYLSSHEQIVIPRGAWIDSFDADGHPLAKSVPASTLYHVFLAFAEALSLSERD